MKDSTTSLFKITRIVSVIFYVIEVLLVLRFILKFMAANPEAAFSALIYGMSSIFMAPFFYVFPVTETPAGIIEWSAVLAMIVYAILYTVIKKTLLTSRPVSQREAKEDLDKMDNLSV